MSALDTLLADLPSLANEELPKLVQLAEAVAAAIQTKGSDPVAVAKAEVAAADVIADADETAKFGAAKPEPTP